MFSQHDDMQTPAARRAQQARSRAKRHAFWQRLFHTINTMFHLHPDDFLAFLKTLLKWSFLGGVVGTAAGTASAVFLVSLDWATHTRLANPFILLGLPAAGFMVGWVYYRFAGSAAQGNNLVVEEVHSNQSRIPLRMAPLVLFGTIITHLFGGSAGREGTAIQMGASLADTLRRILRLNPEDRRFMIMAGISGGFGSVFGTPAAGFVFGLEVQSVGRVRYEGIVPCLVAALVGDLVTRAWGVGHAHYPALAHIEIEPLLLLKVALAGVAFGITSIVFVELTHGIKHLHSHFIKYPPLRPLFGGLAIGGLVLLLNTEDYLGLGLPLIQDSLSGAGVVTFAFLFKLIFTAVTLGSGFLGGEVTPLFVIGATQGYTLGVWLGVDPVFMASIGFVAVFAGASNTPLACALMGMELFGGGGPVYLILGCMVAYLASGHRGIYVTQRIGAAKTVGATVYADESLKSIADRRSGWLPPLPQLSGAPSRRLVRAVMSQPAVFVREETELRAWVGLALREGVRAIPVVNADKIVVGMLTDNDLHKASDGLNLALLQHMSDDEREAALARVDNKPARLLMSQPVVTISHLAPLWQAIDTLTQTRLKRLPCVDDIGHLLGMLTRSDILREVAFSEAAEEDALFVWDAVVADVLLEPAVIVAADALLDAVVEALVNNGRKRAVVVHASGKLAGIVSESDLLDRVQNGHRATLLGLLRGEKVETLFTQTAAQVMTTPVLTTHLHTSAQEALKRLMDNQIKRLPVVDENQHVLGMVGREGLLRVLLRG